MIEFHYETDIQIVTEKCFRNWVNSIVLSENKSIGQIDYILCDDAYLLKINQDYLKHEDYTDIITFDYVEGQILSGDIFISVERVRENAGIYGVDFEEELRRVMAHGILHLAGYGDKSEKESLLMRNKENEKMKLFHVEQ